MPIASEAPGGLGTVTDEVPRSLEPLRAYTGEDVRLRLPGGLTLAQLDWLALYDVVAQRALASVLLPDALNVPPALTKLHPFKYASPDPRQRDARGPGLTRCFSSAGARCPTAARCTVTSRPRGRSSATKSPFSSPARYRSGPTVLWRKLSRVKSEVANSIPFDRLDLFPALVDRSAPTTTWRSACRARRGERRCWARMWRWRGSTRGCSAASPPTITSQRSHRSVLRRRGKGAAVLAPVPRPSALTRQPGLTAVAGAVRAGAGRVARRMPRRPPGRFGLQPGVLGQQGGRCYRRDLSS